MFAILECSPYSRNGHIFFTKSNYFRKETEELLAALVIRRTSRSESFGFRPVFFCPIIFFIFKKIRHNFMTARSIKCNNLTFLNIAQFLFPRYFSSKCANIKNYSVIFKENILNNLYIIENVHAHLSIQFLKYSLFTCGAIIMKMQIFTEDSVAFK